MRGGKISGGLWRDTLVVSGTIIYALGVYIFNAPNHIAPGGVSGFATVMNYLFSIPVGILTAGINLPLVVAGYRRLGRGFMFRTLLSVVTFTVAYDYVLPFLPYYTGNMLLAGVFGGVFIGIGVGLTFLGEGSTGGLDISSKLIQLRYPHIKISIAVFASDMAVILFSAIAYKDFDSALYGAVSMYVQLKCIDFVLYGANSGCMMLVVTGRESGGVIAGEILSQMDRGVTILNSRGGYSGKDSLLLLCAVHQREYPRLKAIVRGIDANAFVVAVTASEVVGNGFRSD